MSPIPESDENQRGNTKDKNFFVVGIGASAGGLRALEELSELKSKAPSI